jgi:hypothetical protein
VDGDALHVVAGDFDLASMKATANLNVERANRRLGNGAGATHGTRGAVEGGEKPVPDLRGSHDVSGGWQNPTAGSGLSLRYDALATKRAGVLIDHAAVARVALVDR